MFNRSYDLVHPVTIFEEDEDYNRYKLAIKEQLAKMQIKHGEVIKMGSLVAIPETFDKDAPDESRKSTMSMAILTPSKKLLPTNVVIDPAWRKPIFGRFADDDHETPEISRSNRFQFVVKEKIGSKTGTSLDFMQTGRTLINYAEYLKMEDELFKANEIYVLKVPLEKFSAAQR